MDNKRFSRKIVKQASDEWTKQIPLLLLSDLSHRILFFSIAGILAICFIFSLTGLIVSAIQSDAALSSRITLFCIISAISVIFLVLFSIYSARSAYSIFKNSFTDRVTKGPNWRLFAIQFNAFVASNIDKKFALVYTNIHNFKYINESQGYDVGDELLTHIGSVLNTQLNDNESFCRVTAERFVFFLEYEDDNDLMHRLDNIDTRITGFFDNLPEKTTIHQQYGIYKIKNNRSNINHICDRALLALHEISGDANISYGFYNDVIHKKLMREQILESDMYVALEEKQFAVYLQPKFDLKNNSLVGAEALARWIHPIHGLLFPGDFIDLFERNGFVVKLDIFIFTSICEMLCKWIAEGIPTVPISVNLSRVHLYNPNIAEELYYIAMQYGVPTSLLEIELTESADFQNTQLFLSIVSRLKRFGFIVSIDDFGSGYSSLNMLKDLPVDILKIDREFLNGSPDEGRGHEITSSIIDLAKRLEMKTIAEGVEYEEQAAFLHDRECDYVQGFLYSKPISVPAFEAQYMQKLKAE